METPAPRIRSKSHESPTPSRFSRPSPADLQAHPLLLRRGSSEPPNNQVNVTAELIVLNRTSSFSKVTYELTETADVAKKKQVLSPRSATVVPAPPKTKALHFGARMGILLSRSSGRDKFAGLIQYFAMFCGHQTLVGVSQEADAPWRNVEESMSGGRKVLRLLKWIKELERVQRSLTHEDIGPHRGRARAVIARVLGFFMHLFSTMYYLADNVIWASSVGLINRGPPMKGEPGRNLSVDEYIAWQKRFRRDEQLRFEASQRDKAMKNTKNYASFARLCFCIAYCALQLDSIRKEYARMGVCEEELGKLVQDGCDDYDGDSSNSSDGGKEAARAELKAKFAELEELALENRRELWAAVCNLLILLRRLEMGIFARVPLWGVGLLGMASSLLGLHKNWPVVA